MQHLVQYFDFSHHFSTVPSSPDTFRLPTELYYASDDCTSMGDIISNFTPLIGQLMTDSNYCGDDGQLCDVTNIQITCGPAQPTGRRRRNINDRKMGVKKDSGSSPIAGFLNEWIPNINSTQDKELAAHEIATIMSWIGEGKLTKPRSSSRHVPWEQADYIPSQKKRNNLIKSKRDAHFDLDIIFDVVMKFSPQAWQAGDDLTVASWDRVDDFYAMMFRIYESTLDGSLVPDVENIDIASRLVNGYAIYYWDVFPDCDPGDVPSGKAMLCGMY